MSPLGPQQENTSTSPSIFCSAANSTSAFRPTLSILFGRDGANTPGEIGQRWSRPVIGAVKFGWEPMGEQASPDVELVRGAPSGVGDERDAVNRCRLCVGCADGPEPRPGIWPSPHRLAWKKLRGDVDCYACLARTGCPCRIAAGDPPECGRESSRPLIVSPPAMDVYQVDISRTGFTIARLSGRVERLAHGSAIIVTPARLRWLPRCTGSHLPDASYLRIASMIRPCATKVYSPKTPGQRRSGIAVPDRPGLGITLSRGIHQAVSGRGVRKMKKHQAPTPNTKEPPSTKLQYLGSDCPFWSLCFGDSLLPVASAHARSG